MSLTTDSSWASMPAFRNRSTPTKAEWEAIRPTFTDLYRLQNRRLVDVMEALDRQYGFRATTKMYKSKITFWGLNKNLKRKEARRLLRIKQKHESEGKSCVLLHKAGFLIDVANFERRSRRPRPKRTDDSVELLNSEDDGISDASAVQCVLLSSTFSAIDDPDLFSLVQRLLYHAALGLESFATTCPSLSQDQIWTDQVGPDLNPLKLITRGLLLFHENDYAAGGRFLRRGFSFLPSLFLAKQDAYFFDLDGALGHLGLCAWFGFRDTVRCVASYLVQLSEIYFPFGHPYRTALRALMQLTELCWDEWPIGKLLKALTRASMQSLLPEFHAEVIWYEMTSLEADGLLCPVAFLDSIENTCGPESRRMARAISFCVGTAYAWNDWQLVETVLLRYQHCNWSVRWQALNAVRLAHAQAMLNKHSSAMESLQRARNEMRSDGQDMQEYLVVILGYYDELIPWLKSLPPENEAVVDIQLLLKSYDDYLELWDQAEQQDTMLVMQQSGFGWAEPEDSSQQWPVSGKCG